MGTPYFVDYARATDNRPVPVKTEDLSSPDLSPPASSLTPFHFKFQPSHGTLSHSRSPSDLQVPHVPLFRFGLNNTNTTHWPSQKFHSPLSSASSHKSAQFHIHNSVEPNMSYSDDYDDLADLPVDQHVGPGSSTSNDRTVRRRSSKACDQCRKSKCKCERTGPNEPCKNCIMLGTPCTFLGPSRKRGPPKGYIDAIEARLHQTEALLGIMLASSDPRATSLLRDIGKDPLAKEIIARVDNSPYGVKGRKREDIALSVVGKIRSAHSSETSLPRQAKGETSSTIDLTSTHPSNEWQDRVSSMLGAVASASPDQQADNRDPPTPKSHSSDENLSPGGRRQRRRIGDDDYPLQQGNSASESSASQHLALDTTSSTSGTRVQSNRGPYAPSSPIRGRFRQGRSTHGGEFTGDDRSPSVDENSFTSDSEEEIMGAVGQLSLNEDEQVRYHGKTSGLHLLGNKERVDRRNEGGIWRFPKARVWPPLPSSSAILSGEDEFASQLPPPHVQEHLLDLYFTYVQPLFPIIHKNSFLESYRSLPTAESPQTPDTDPNNGSPFNKQHRRIPSVLLLSMFALASRYDEINTKPPSDPSVMWSAGDEYLDHAKVMLDRTYASSRPSTCQALLLMGYREIGIGAMAQAWTYIGMAIRMAQDLGMHRSADGWERVGLGGRLFSESELNERKRIWYGCVIMDKYVSTYIGRPLMIFEWDFDTPLPNDDDPEEFEGWSLETPHGEPSPSLSARNISCFNASASLSGIMGSILQSIYAVRPLSSRHAESAVLESLMDKWYLDLPDHLRYEPSSTKVPLPNVLTLHMQYWCAVLLLHRPFIRHLVQSKQKQSEGSDDPETRALTAKSYELCNAAANHITTIVSLFQEKYLITRCSVFLCYYVFTASIMHDTTLTVHPNDPQARLGLSKCMNTLRAMRVVWPSAARALDLFGGAKGDGSMEPDLISLTRITERNKRAAETPLDDHTFTGHPLDPQQQQQQGFVTEYVNASANVRSRQPRTIQHQTSTSSFTTHDHSVSAFATGGEPVYLPPAPQPPQPSATTTMGPTANNNYTWQPNEMNPHHYNTPLSTAVLPHLFSTGLVDDVIHDSHSHSRGQGVHGGAGSEHPAHHLRSRYPQYFDYSTAAAYPQQQQLATHGYDTLAQGMGIQQQQPQQHHSQPSQIYLSEQYNIYNNPAYNNR